MLALGACDHRADSEPGAAGDRGAQRRAVTSPNRCEITLTACPIHPEMPLGTPFLDDIDGAGSNPDRCLRRAEEYRQWCGASTLQSVQARAFLANAVIGTEIAPPTRCEITLDACPNYPTMPLKPFLDDTDGSGSNSTRCLGRASDYWSWCGNSTTQAVTARAFSGSYFVASERAPLTRCEITLTACPAHSSWLALSPFLDDSAGSGANATRCLGRAEEYRTSCGATVTQPVTAQAFAAGALAGSQTAGRGFGFTEHLYSNTYGGYSPATKLTSVNFENYLADTKDWTQWVRTIVANGEVLSGSHITHQGGYVKLDHYWAASLGRSQLVPDVTPAGRAAVKVDHLRFRQAEWIGYASDTAGAGKTELLSCSYPTGQSRDYFVTPSPYECASPGQVEGSLGYVWTGSGTDRVQVYRCYDATWGAHFVSLDPTCGGRTQEFSLGYVYRPATAIPLDLSGLLSPTSVGALMALRTSLEKAHADGRRVYLVTSPTGLWNNLNFSDFVWVTRRFYQALIEQLGDQVDVWQVMNEADWSHYRDYRLMATDNYPPALDSGYLSEVQAILRTVGGMIKGAHRGALVTTNSAAFPREAATTADVENKLILYLSAINPYVDVIANDIYPSDFIKPWVPGYLANFHLWYKKPVWVTETGWNGADAEKAGKLTDFLNNLFLNSVASAIFVYNFNDLDVFGIQDHYGVAPWKTDGTGYSLGPAETAVKTTLTGWVAAHSWWLD
jgi:hypothetical protein